MPQKTDTIPYKTRFAPSPTGALHFGSLVAAVGSWLQARTRNGIWQVRIEDIDPPRTVPGAAEEQIETLARFGLFADGEVIYQSHFEARHNRAIETLLDSGLAYHCGCSRRDLPRSGIYPGTCTNGLPPGKRPRSVRLRTDQAGTIVFTDRIQGRRSEHPGEHTGDFIIRRADGLVAYQLAVVVDDAAAGITEVVRGADLLESTARQIHVYHSLGLTPPDWMHLPVVAAPNGRKLSKSDGDDPIVRYPPATALRLALDALGHRPPDDCGGVDELLDWARQAWDPSAVPRGPVRIDTRQTERGRVQRQLPESYTD